jgi:hypothetical protein
MSLKNPVTPRGIDPGTVRLVAQRLNHYATPGPNLLEVLVVFLATCFGSYTEPSSVSSSEWFVCTVVGALKVTKFRTSSSN